MLKSVQQHSAISSVLSKASEVYSENVGEHSDSFVPWKLSSPEEGKENAVIPAEGNEFFSNCYKLSLCSRIINAMVREGYSSVLDLGSGCGIFPALVSRTGIVPYAIGESEDIYLNSHWLEHETYNADAHIFRADTASFIRSLIWAAKSGERPLYVDCITLIDKYRPGAAPDNVRKMHEELKTLVCIAPSMCRSLVLSGDIISGQIIAETLIRRNVEYSINYIFGNTSYSLPKYQQVHYMITFGKSTLPQWYCNDEIMKEIPGFGPVPKSPNEYGFWTRITTGEPIRCARHFYLALKQDGCRGLWSEKEMNG